MKTKSIFTILISLLMNVSAFAGHDIGIILKGRVTDKDTGAPIEGAAVDIPSLRVGTGTDKDGNYLLKNVSAGKLTVTIRSLGYKTITQTVDFSKTETADFAMEMAAIEGQEVVVTGASLHGTSSRNSTPVTSLSKKEITQSGAATLIDALSHVPGVAQVTTGGAISKPVIRGLSSNRVLTLSNDVKQEGQQWGDEHGIEIDQYAAGKVEVLRGPASLFYGSDALGGVINVIDPLVASPGELHGGVSTAYSSNNGLTASSLMLNGNANGFVYRLNGTYKNAMSYNTPMGRVYNSAFREDDASAMVGLNKSWGFAHVTYSRFNTKIGMTDEGPDADGVYHDHDENPVSDKDLKSRNLFLPLQHITHDKLVLNSNVNMGQGFLKTTIGFQHNRRRELEDDFETPNTFFDLTTYSFDSKYYFPEKNGWTTVAGIAANQQRNLNKAGEALIPAYDQTSTGGFVYAKKEWQKLTLDAGARYDWRTLKGKEEFDFEPFTNNASAVSGSVGGTYQLNDAWHVKANVGRGFRSPNIAELSANGVHEGTDRYEIGNPDLKNEQSLQFDGTIAWEGKYFGLELNGYANYINNFVYYQNTNGETKDVDGTEFALYRYIQGNSLLKGGELSLDLHPIKVLHFENTLAYTRGTNRSSGADLPFIPAFKINNTLRYTIGLDKESRFNGAYLSVGLENTFAQDKVDPFESTSKGYTLFNASVGATLKGTNGKEILTAYLVGKNLLDQRYIDHLSRFRDMGISNIGRNVTLGLNVPF